MKDLTKVLCIYCIQVQVLTLEQAYSQKKMRKVVWANTLHQRGQF